MSDAPHFIRANIANDIGALRMSDHFPSERDFPPSVGTVCLAADRMPDGDLVTATGWGNTGSGQSPYLKEVQRWTVSLLPPLVGTIHKARPQNIRDL